MICLNWMIFKVKADVINIYIDPGGIKWDYLSQLGEKNDCKNFSYFNINLVSSNIQYFSPRYTPHSKKVIMKLGKNM